MSIFPLPVFETDADPHNRSTLNDEEIYAWLEAPKTIVIRYGYLRQVAEFPYDGSAKPGCGSKLVARTWRGVEVVEMLTTTCSNSGCGKSISRREMLDYIENSGGKDYPFTNKGRILRIATIEDLNQHSALESVRREAVRFAKAAVAELNLPMKIVEAEPILGGETVTVYYLSEARIDFRELVLRLAAELKTRIEMRQVGARDEARLVADYERCGQHCCCKNFLKVLKPVSMRQAKVQKATLDPLKISGRCGRLMCCLRYEDQTYKELKSKLPNRSKRVGTSEGPGVVVDSKILVQLVLVRLEHNMQEIAVPVEELMDPDKCPKPRAADTPEMGQVRDGRDGRGGRREERSQRSSSAVQRASEPPLESLPPTPQQRPTSDDPLRGLTEEQAASRAGDGDGDGEAGGGQRKKRRRRRRGRRGVESGEGTDRSPNQRTQQSPSAEGAQPRPPRHDQQDAYRAMSRDSGEGGDIDPADSGAPGAAPDSGARKRKRRRRRRRGGGGGQQGGQPGPGPTGPSA